MGLVVVLESEAWSWGERGAAVAATFAPEEGYAGEESDEGCFVLLGGSTRDVLGATYP